MTDENIHQVRLPKVGAGGFGVVISWEVEVGATVAVGDFLAEVELEKTTVEVESPVAGQVISLDVAAGEEVDSGTVIAQIERQTTQ